MKRGSYAPAINFTLLRLLLCAAILPAAMTLGGCEVAATVSGPVTAPIATTSPTPSPVAQNHAPAAVAQSLSINDNATLSIILAASDADSDSLAYSVVTSPSHGSLSGSAPNLTYTPNLPYNGSDSFTFKVNDGTVDSATATISITVTHVNHAPSTPASISCLTSPLGGATAQACTLTAASPTDSDGDSVAYFDAASTCSAVVVNSVTGSATFTAPAKGATCLVKVKAYDGALFSSALISATITGANHPPVATTQSVSVSYNTATAITLAGTDADSDSLTYTVVAQPSHGSLSGSAPNLTYTPAAGYYGSDSFMFKVNDGTSDSTVATVSLTTAQPHTFYLSTTGNDGTGTPDDPTKPYLTAQAAYNAASSYQQNSNGKVLISISSGTFIGITLAADWNSSVHLRGAGSSASSLGGIIANGRNDNNAGNEALPGHAVSIFGLGLNLGNISSNGGTMDTRNGATCSSGNYDGGTITVHSGLTAGNVTSNGGNAATDSNNYSTEGGGSVVIEAGATVGTITAKGYDELLENHANGYVCWGYAGKGGTVTVQGASGAINVSGGDTEVDTGGPGGTVLVTGTSGAITASAGGLVAGGAPGFLAWGGSVTVGGTSDDITANGGVNSFGGTENSLAGGTILVTASGHAGNIMANGGGNIPGIGSGLNSDPAGINVDHTGKGGVVTVAGIAGTIQAKGGAPGRGNGVDGGIFGGRGGVVSVSGLTGDIDVSGAAGGDGYDDTGNGNGIDPGGNGGHGGSVTVSAAAITANVTANGGNAGADVGGGQGSGGAAGSVAADLTSTHGTITAIAGTP